MRGPENDSAGSVRKQSFRVTTSLGAGGSARARARHARAVRQLPCLTLPARPLPPSLAPRPPGGPYTAIAYADITQDVPDVRPLFYGLWAFTDASQHYANVMKATVTSSNPLVKAWATLDARGTWRVVVVHKDSNATSAAGVTVQPPAGVTGATGALRRLASAGGIFATSDLSFGGLTFDGSTTGKPSGTPVSEKVVPQSGAYAFSVPPASIAVLSFTVA